ncbi:MAG: HAD-IA family hydrolase, partial [Myxococcota bacterium]
GEMGLPGKPAPDLFLEAARRISADPAKSAVFEDATSGVEAGAAAGYGLVVGVARGDNAEDLKEAGADIVVTDLRELPEEELIGTDQEEVEKR